MVAPQPCAREEACHCQASGSRSVCRGSQRSLQSAGLRADSRSHCRLPPFVHALPTHWSPDEDTLVDRSHELKTISWQAETSACLDSPHIKTKAVDYSEEHGGGCCFFSSPRLFVVKIDVRRDATKTQKEKGRHATYREGRSSGFLYDALLVSSSSLSLQARASAVAH